MNEDRKFPVDLAAAVTRNLQTLLGKYQQMDGLADDMLARQNQGGSIHEQLELLKTGREEILAIEQQAGPTAQRYRETTAHASPAIREITDETKQLIESLMIKVASLEKSARQSYQHLAPEIDRSVRAHQMKQAYGKGPS